MIQSKDNMLSKRLSICLASVLVLLLLLSCDKEVSVSPEELPPFTGKMIIQSEPAGAYAVAARFRTNRIWPTRLSQTRERIGSGARPTTAGRRNRM